MAQTRRLAAILAADVAGYSRLMGVDEEGTLARLKGLRRELADPKIKEHRGRIVKTTGDGLLVEFQSVVDAVRCAVDVQREMALRNTDVPVDRRIEFRIGINLGDIIKDRGDIFGDGVNVAARLEALAELGGICVSRVVRDQVRDKLDFGFEDRGEQQVKNIARPVRAFDVRIAAESAVRTPEPPVQAALPLPEKPSIAVLPFTNMSGDPEQEYFADGIVEDIITGLSRIKWLFVIARNSSFVYKGRTTDVKQAGRELGVRYVLEGSVRKAGNQVRVTGQLIDTANATHVWAQRYDRALDDIFALQDELTMSVIGAIEPTLRQAEIERAKRKRPDSLDAYDLYLRALPFAFTAMPEFVDQALSLLKQAIDIEPDYAAAHAYIAWCYEIRHLRGGLHDEARAAGLRHARLAMATGGDDAAALAVAGFVIGILERDYQTAFNAFDRDRAESFFGAGIRLQLVHPGMGRGQRDICRARRNRNPPQPVRSTNLLPPHRFRLRAFFCRRFRRSGPRRGPGSAIEPAVQRCLPVAGRRLGQSRPHRRSEGERPPIALARADLYSRGLRRGELHQS
jgi:adenylate cyclase